MNTERKLEIIPRVDSLRTLGIGMEYYPAWVNQKMDAQHSLDIILMSFIIRGNVTHHLDEETYPESDLSLSIINYGQQHNITTSPAGADIMNIYLDLKHYILPVLPEPLQEVVPLFLPVHLSMQNKLNRMLRIQFNEDDDMESLLQEMKRELDQAAPGFETAVKDYLRIFMIKCARKVRQRYLRPAAEINSHALKKLEKLRQFLDQNYKTPYQIEELAGMSTFSPNYLCRIFKEYTGKTLTEYLNERRIQSAMLLLSTSSKPVTEIANLAGFHDLSHFNHLFKRFAGKSPRGFRGRRSEVRSR